MIPLVLKGKVSPMFHVVDSSSSGCICTLKAFGCILQRLAGAEVMFQTLSLCSSKITFSTFSYSTLEIAVLAKSSNAFLDFEKFLLWTTCFP
mmetsp:Transcript_26903/g.43250  ORF Transcript_26903/g.43250 Transcript_26903/m.43250 type:complete len:92 (-) Transcript_26903:308-583(-)